VHLQESTASEEPCNDINLRKGKREREGLTTSKSLAACDGMLGLELTPICLRVLARNHPHRRKHTMNEGPQDRPLVAALNGEQKVTDIAGGDKSFSLQSH